MQFLLKTTLPLILGAAAAAAVHAQSLPPPDGVLTLTATAHIEVPQDWMTLTFSVAKEGSDAASVQSQIRQAVEAALAEARRVAKPGQVEVQTGAFSLYPRYGQKGAMSGWHGTAQLIVQGRDMPALAQLSGRIGTMTIAQVAYSISRETREKLEGEAAAQAIARYGAQAAGYAKAFGYGGYRLREVQVMHEGASPPVVPAMARARLSAEAADASLPVEAGKGMVSATVSGSVQLTK
jgi:predicted secreted protein